MVVLAKASGNFNNSDFFLLQKLNLEFPYFLLPVLLASPIQNSFRSHWSNTFFITFFCSMIFFRVVPRLLKTFFRNHYYYKNIISISSLYKYTTKFLVYDQPSTIKKVKSNLWTLKTCMFAFQSKLRETVRFLT